MGAAGRACISAIISLALLGTGVVIERRERYRIFSGGLIGAGWAAAYITAYAMYALPAARVITSPFAGSVLLLAVAAAMIAHSLRYQVQAITSVAYFTAFGALAVTPSTPFAVASLVPLAASLLYFAWHFRWHSMALFGLMATYGTCISRGNSNAPLYATEALFMIYWALFECFDILRSRRGSIGFGVVWIFPLNTIGFLGLSYSAWSVHPQNDMWRMAAVSAAMFLVSAVLRLPLHLDTTRINDADPLTRLQYGTYEAPLTISAVLAALAILGRVPGLWTNVVLASEAELVYLAGVRFRSRFLRSLSAFGFGASLSNLWTDASGGRTSILGLSLDNWTPSALFHTFLFYLNRVLWRANRPFSFAASALVALILAAETPPHFKGVSLLAFALILFELGIQKRLAEFRIQAYLASFAGVVAALFMGHFSPHPAASIWIACAIAAIECWVLTARVLFTSRDSLTYRECSAVRDAFAAMGSLFALLTLWMVLPGSPTALAWTVLALAWIQLGLALNTPSFRWIGNVILMAAYVRLLGVNLLEVEETDRIHLLVIALPILAVLYYVFGLLKRLPATEEQTLARIYTWLAAIVALRVVYLEFNPFFVASGWAGLAVIFLVAGLRTRLIDFRGQSYCVTLLALLRCLSFNFASSGSSSMAPRIFASSLCIALFFVAQALIPRNAGSPAETERHARTFFSVIATLLLTGLLYNEVSGSLLTLAWGFEGVAFLGAGFPLRERILRLEGLGLLLLCILKLFLYDLRNLETIYRILTFVALGLILLGVSWIYTRFRAQIRRYLCDRFGGARMLELLALSARTLKRGRIMYCRSCGIEISNDFRYCPQCGTGTGKDALRCETGKPGRVLRRSRDEKQIAGVCAGIAKYLSVDVTFIRVLMVCLAVWPPGVGLILYVVCWIVVPQEPLLLMPPRKEDRAQQSATATS
jgi:phage shock protein PspC (stress-responsive transcriptional regulator)